MRRVICSTFLCEQRLAVDSAGRVEQGPSLSTTSCCSGGHDSVVHGPPALTNGLVGCGCLWALSETPTQQWGGSDGVVWGRCHVCHWLIFTTVSMVKCMKPTCY